MTRISGRTDGSQSEAHAPAGVNPTFIAADGRRVWKIEPNLFLIQRDIGPDADDSCIAVAFDADGITPGPWVASGAERRLLNAEIAKPGSDHNPTIGIIWGLALSLPLWGILIWVIRRLLGAD